MDGIIGDGLVRSGLQEQMEMIQSELAAAEPNWAFILMRIDMMRSIGEAALADGQRKQPSSITESA